MLDLIANKFFKGNKNIAFMVCAITGLILIIILIVIIANMFSGGIKSYKDLENELVSSAEKYYKDNSDKLPTTDGSMVSVSDSTLVENGYIKELKKLYSKDTCSATVEVVKSGDNYLYNPILKCEKYTTKTLFDELTSNVVSENSGLYLKNNEYIFKGEYINNYVKFDNKTWRIVGIDENGIKMYLINEKLEKDVWDDRYNLEKKSDYGKNIYDTSRIKVYLENAYENNKYVSEKNKKYLVNATWCIGSIKEGTLISDVNLCNKTMQGYIGLLEVSDYAKASLESSCKRIDDAQCVNYNYMIGLSGTYWTLNSYSENTYEVYAITSNGIESYRASKTNSIMPVIYLNSHTLISSGNGSKEKPYIVR